jgi:para-nitrobenzyl esterase
MFPVTLLVSLVLSLSTVGVGRAAAGYDARTDVVEISSGLVAATRDSGPDIRTFKAIPFAAPPVGGRRWQPPQPVSPWEGVRRSDNFSAQCMQRPPNLRSILYQASESMSEDCLYLNVWTGASSPAERRPVMAFFYGGSNTSGSGSQPDYNGKGLASKGMVVVTFNNRLGPFGFLAHPELTQESANYASGNYALLDQIAALQWVQANIAAFGGDPANVTIYGESAGAYNESVLLASPLARGLFERVVAESAAAFGEGSPNIILADAEQAGVAFATTAGATSLAELRALHASDLLQVAGAWGAVVDGYVLPDQLDQLYASGQIADVPLLVGWNANEATPFPPFATTLAEFQDKAQRIYGVMAPQFLALYPVMSDADAQQQAFGPMSDGHFAWQAYTLARAHQATSRSKTFVYYFTHVPPWYPDQHFSQLDPPSSLGAYHSVEQVYFYNNLDVRPRPYTAADRTLADLTSSYLVNFASSGDPNGGPRALAARWPAFESTGERVMYLDESIAPGPVPFRTAFDFFDAFYAHKLGHPLSFGLDRGGADRPSW